MRPFKAGTRHAKPASRVRSTAVEVPAIRPGRPRPAHLCDWPTYLKLRPTQARGLPQYSHY
jgi:hypothetical protein